MPNPTPSAQAPTNAEPETPAQKWWRKVLELAAPLDDDFPSLTVPPSTAGSIDDDSAIYGADSQRPDFVARDDAAWKG